MKNNKGVAFGNSKKFFNWKTNESPGPANYSVEPGSKYFAPSVQKGSFSKTKKAYWPDQQPKCDAPGPIYKPSKHYTSKLV